MAVLIDCWNIDHSPCRHSVQATETYTTCMQNIRDFCLQDPDLVSVCLATYGEPHTSKVPQDDAWWSMSDRFFNLETKFDDLRQRWQQTEFEPMSLTHESIRDMPRRPGQQRFAAFDTVQILYYCNYIMPEIDKIYFFGAAWDNCVKLRPVGWISLASLQYHSMFRSHKRFLSHRLCVVTEDCEFPQEFDRCWQQWPDSDILELEFDEIVW